MVENRHFFHIPPCIRRPRLGGGGPVGIAPLRLVRKTRMAWLPYGEKNLKISIRFGAIHERDKRTDRQTDGQTPHEGVPILWGKRGPLLG